MAATRYRLGRLVAFALLADQAFAIHRNRESVRLINDSQIPVLVGRVERLPRPVSTEKVTADNDAVELVPWVLREGRIEMTGAQLHEIQMEPLRQLADPLRSQACWSDDKNAVASPPQDQLLHIQACHDGFPGPGIIGEQEPQAGLVQETLVDGLKLVRQRLDVRHRDRCHLVGKRDIDPASLHPQAELYGIPIKPQLTEHFDDLNAGQLRLSEHVLTWSRWRVEVELPKLPRTHGNQRYRLIPSREPNLRAGLEPVHVNSQSQTLPVSSPSHSTLAVFRCHPPRGSP